MSQSTNFNSSKTTQQPNLDSDLSPLMLKNLPEDVLSLFDNKERGLLLQTSQEMRKLFANHRPLCKVHAHPGASTKDLTDGLISQMKHSDIQSITIRNKRNLTTEGNFHILC